MLPVLWFKDPLRLIRKIVCFNILILKASLNLPYEKVCTVYENQFNFMTVNWPIVYMMCIYSNPMDPMEPMGEPHGAPPGSSVQGIFLQGIFWTQGWNPLSPVLPGRFFTIELPGNVAEGHLGFFLVFGCFH